MSAREGLAAAAAGVEQALTDLRGQVQEQEGLVEAAEFGPHGQADRIQAESERLDRLQELVERLVSAAEDLREIAGELEAL